MKILVVEDDRAVAQSLQLLLSSYSYSVDIAIDGEEALQLANAFEYHLVLLDVLLPRLSGIEVCRQLRKKGFRQPILLLTGQGETQQKTTALNIGADDYVVKPFDNDELVARIQALLRRGGTVGDPILIWGYLSLDPNIRKVAYRDQLLVLTPKEYAILELFLRHQETVFSAKAILNQAWSSTESPGEEVVRCHIKDLRQKLMAAGAPKDLIKTVYRVGYRLNPLYAASTPLQVEQSLTAPQVAELRSVNEELRVAMEQLQLTQAELQQRNQELQAARNELQRRVDDRTTELHESEQRYRHLLELAPLLIWNADAQGRNTYISPKMSEYIGLPSEALLDFDWQSTVHPDDVDYIHRCWMESVQTGTPYEAEYRLRRADGEYRWHLVRAVPVQQEQGMQWFGVSTDIHDRKQAAEALRESGRKYRSLFNSMDEGFHIIELIDDEAGAVIDYRFLEGNPAFERLTGLQNTAGRLGSEVAPQTESYWLEAYDRVARTGESLRIENYSQDTERWYSAHASRVGDDGSRQVAIVFDDITERKQHEQRQAFLLQLSDALRSLSDPLEIQRAVMRIIGESLQVDRVMYSDITPDGKLWIARDNYTSGRLSKLIGSFPTASFSTSVETLKRGEVVIISNVEDATDLTEAEKALYEATNTRSALGVPLIKDGRWLSNIGIHHAEPRHWTAAEIALVQETAERTWETVERARAEAAIEDDLRDTQRLHGLATRLVFEDDQQAVYQEIIKTAIALTQADAGSFQILDETTQELMLIATQGIDRTLTEHFYRLDASSSTSCGVALATGERTFINFDVPESQDPDGSLRMHKDAGLYCVQSTPLRSRSGKPIGMVSTHWREEHQLSDRELRFLDLLARQAADLIEQQQVEQSLRESEQKYRSLFNSIDDGFCIIERVPGDLIDFRYLEANPAFAVHTGIREVVGKTIREVAPDVPEAVYQIYENVLNTGEPIRSEIDVPSLDSPSLRDAARTETLRERILEIYAFRTEDEPRLAVIFKDISDRKRAEQRQAFLFALADRLRPIADPVEVMSTASETLGQYLGVGRCGYGEVDATDEFLIIERDWTDEIMASLRGTLRLDDFGPEFIGAYQAGHTVILNDVLADLRARGVEEAFDAIGGLRASLAVPLVKEGRWVSVFYVQQTQPRQWTSDDEALVREVAERTWATVERARAETALRESELERVREQSEREQERQRAESLAELDRAKTQFFSNISHEFRTPLTLILGLLEDALKRVDEWESEHTNENRSPDVPLDRSTLKDPLQVAYRNGLRLLKLVNTLLDFSRIEADRLQASYQPTELASYTAELASVFRSTIEHANLQLVVDCPPLSEPIYVDRGMWEKIVLNLISNAFKFTFAGEICVRLRSQSRSKSKNKKQKTKNLDSAILEIQDTGIGIPATDLPHLFERFYQVKGARGRSYEGSGIGLALVQELVKLHGGTITVSSTVGQGSCFTVTIPTGRAHLPPEQIQDISLPVPSISQVSAYIEEMHSWQPETTANFPFLDLDEGAIAPPATTDSSHLAPQEPMPRILVVDDNADMQGYLRRLLSQRYRVDSVSNGVAALEAIAAQPPDLVVTDSMMPELNGLEVLRSLRNNPQTQDIPVILLSARAGEAAQIEGLALGADDYLIKPFSARELLARVDAHLKLTRMRRDMATQAAEIQITQLLNERLEQQVEARTMQLQSLNQELEAFAHSISHDLKTPLRYISSFAQQLRPLLDSSADHASASRSTILDIILRSATAAEQLVDHVLEFSRMGQAEMRMTRVSMQQLVQQVQTQLQAQLEGRTIHWQIAALPSVMGDPILLQLVWQNLLSNAVKYTRDRPIAEITIDYSDTETEIIFSVTDNGAGFDMKYANHLFNLFQRLHPQDTFTGNGVGLANVRRIIHRHGGRTWAEGAIERGATFYFSLPKQEDAP